MVDAVGLVGDVLSDCDGLHGGSASLVGNGAFVAAQTAVCYLYTDT
jgi:hypothetical protein